MLNTGLIYKKKKYKIKVDLFYLLTFELVIIRKASILIAKNDVTRNAETSPANE